MKYQKIPAGIGKVIQGFIGGVVLMCILLFAGVKGCVDEVFGQPPMTQEEREQLSHEYSTMHDYLDGRPAKSYTPRFGLDPIGQAIVRGREDTLDQERRIRLLERQVAQLQRIVFQDPNIQPPSYPDILPRPLRLDADPIGSGPVESGVPK